MLRFAQPRFRWFRIALLVMLALGVIARPVINAIGSMHALEHDGTLASLVEAHGAHEHGSNSDKDRNQDKGDEQSPAHGLMHLVQAGTAEYFVALPVLPRALLQAQTVPVFHAPAHARIRFATPFRPPIA